MAKGFKTGGRQKGGWHLCTGISQCPMIENEAAT